ncbi:MAG: OmpA family protein, partial [Verrucomicrobiota bacterium]
SKPIPTLPLDLPQEKPVLTEIRVSPQLPELNSPLPLEKPPISKMSADSITRAEKESQRQMEQALATLSDLAPKEGPHSSRQPLLKLPPAGKPGAEGLAGTEGIPGLQTVNDLLSKTGSLPTGTRAGIPGGTIYEHGSAELRESAVAQLQKLGELIKRHPNATFIIEGHTDSTGKPQANQILSEDRANSVKDWLIAHFNIAPDRIDTIGLGNSKMIVQPQPYDLHSPEAFELEIARQQPNRRVEIVIKTNRQ